MLAAVLVAGCGGTATPARAPVDTPACISKATSDVLQSIDGPAVIHAYVTYDDAKYGVFARRLEALLRAYERSAHGKLRVEMVVADTPEKQRAAEKLGLKRVKLDETKSAYSGLAFEYGPESDIIPVLTDDESGLELWITTKIRELRDKVQGRKYRIGFTTGHGEIALSDANLVPISAGKPSMKEVIVRNFPFYELVDVDLSKPIDATLRGIVITQPESDFTIDELARVDDFVMKGKALVVFASAVNVARGDATMTARLSRHGLDKLLEAYGVEMRNDVILDFRTGYGSRSRRATEPCHSSCRRS